MGSSLFSKDNASLPQCWMHKPSLSYAQDTVSRPSEQKCPHFPRFSISCQMPKVTRSSFSCSVIFDTSLQTNILRHPFLQPTDKCSWTDYVTGTHTDSKHLARIFKRNIVTTDRIQDTFGGSNISKESLQNPFFRRRSVRRFWCFIPFQRVAAMPAIMRMVATEHCFPTPWTRSVFDI